MDGPRSPTNIVQNCASTSLLTDVRGFGVFRRRGEEARRRRIGSAAAGAVGWQAADEFLSLSTKKKKRQMRRIGSRRRRPKARRNVTRTGTAGASYPSAECSQTPNFRRMRRLWRSDEGERTSAARVPFVLSCSAGCKDVRIRYVGRRRARALLQVAAAAAAIVVHCRRRTVENVLLALLPPNTTTACVRTNCCCCCCCYSAEAQARVHERIVLSRPLPRARAAGRPRGARRTPTTARIASHRAP